MFRDIDGQHYLYYGGWRRCNVVRLSEDFRSLKPFPDGTLFRVSSASSRRNGQGRDHRVTCIDRMEFDENGFIKSVVMTFEGVEAVTIGRP